MQLVICDDDTKDLLELEKLLLRYSTCFPEVPFEIEKYADASLLLHNIQKEKIADIYIRHIYVKGVRN